MPTAKVPESPDDLTWLRKLEDLEDNDGERLLTEDSDFDECEMPQTLRRLIDNYVQRASSDTLQELFDIWNETISKTPRDLNALSKEGGLLNERQARIRRECTETLRPKSRFIYKHVILATLIKGRWSQDDIIGLIIDSLDRFQEYYDWFPQHKTFAPFLIQRFEVREHLADITSDVWYELCHSGNSLFGRADDRIKLSRSQSEQLVPVLRQLAMRDLVDRDWNTVGSWSDILTYLEEAGVYVNRLSSDAALETWSKVLSKARNSVRCQVLEAPRASSSVSGFGPTMQAQQRWTYYPKCSAIGCSNMETPDEPHSLRCGRCHYYHYCSRACQDYCETFTRYHENHCDNSPPDKISVTKRQMRTFLKLEEGVKEATICKACGKKTDDLQRCGRCKKVKYCSRFCQQWDWEQNDHKQVCKKKKPAN